MPNKTDISKLIANHQRRLQKLKEQQALEGISTDPEILIEVEDIEKTIAELQAELKRSGHIELNFDDRQLQDHMNQIPQRQNQERFLQYLAAQRQLYDEEKKWMTIWMVFASGVAIFGTGALAALAPFTPYITLVTLLLIVGEFLVLPFIMNRRQEAAKIQELFDCELLELRWNDILVTKPKPETILAAAERFTQQRSLEAWEKLKNWYTPEVGTLPLHQARVACQKENLWWNSRQRREYAGWVYLAIVLFLFTIIIIGVIANWSLQQFFQGPLLLALPVLAIGLKHGYDQQKAAARLDELCQFADKLWQEASGETADPVAITQRSRELQNEIFRHRSEDPPIPSWFYNLKKEIYEKLIKKIIPK